MENLGKKGKDIVTGFTGIIVGKLSYLTGCDQYGIAPDSLDNGKVIPTEWFDIRRVKIVGKGIKVAQVKDEKDPGGLNRDQPN